MKLVIDAILIVALLVHLLLIVTCTFKVWRGQNAVDRLIGADLIGILALSVLVILALITGQTLYIDVALGLAALGSIITILIAKFITDESAF